MRIIGFITEATMIKAIPGHLGEPKSPQLEGHCASLPVSPTL